MMTAALKRPPRRLQKRPAAPRRVAAFNSGVSAEAAAAADLVAQGFEILAQRHRTPSGEIDLVARRDTLIVFVEVKARARIDDAAYAVTARQQGRIIAAAQIWLQGWLDTHPDHAGYDLRFDVMLVAPGQPLVHLAAAFDASD